MAVKCPLCGHRFLTENAEGICSSCPMGSGCAKICCPNCGYSWLESTSIIGRLLDKSKRGKKVL